MKRLSRRLVKPSLFSSSKLSTRGQEYVPFNVIVRFINVFLLLVGLQVWNVVVGASTHPQVRVHGYHQRRLVIRTVTYHTAAELLVSRLRRSLGANPVPRFRPAMLVFLSSLRRSLTDHFHYSYHQANQGTSKLERGKFYMRDRV